MQIIVAGFFPFSSPQSPLCTLTKLMKFIQTHREEQPIENCGADFASCEPVCQLQTQDSVNHALHRRYLHSILRGCNKHRVCKSLM